MTVFVLCYPQLKLLLCLLPASSVQRGLSEGISWVLCCWLPGFSDIKHWVSLRLQLYSLIRYYMCRFLTLVFSLSLSVPEVVADFCLIPVKNPSCLFFTPPMLETSSTIVEWKEACQTHADVKHGYPQLI